MIKSNLETLARRSDRQRGFALIITVSLLALLVLVMVALATLTRVETSIGTNSRIDAQAKQNALYALNIAVGELQRNAGPDARITAQSNIKSASIANNHWTGVWHSAGGLRTWLVSGNENLPDSDPATDAVPNDDPAEAVSGLNPYVSVANPGSLPTSDEILVGGKPARLLVGYKSGGSDADNNGTPDTLNYVVAPLVDLKAPVAAFGSTSLPATIGRYAWWVGDDGTKASMALPDRWSQVDYGPYASTELHNRMRQQVPFAHESFIASGGSGTPKSGFDPADSNNSAAIPNVLQRPQLAFLTPVSGTAISSTIDNRYHDWTTVAYGVLASTDPNYPGLKRDLSMQPGLLGPQFAKWADYSRPGYMAEPLNPPASYNGVNQPPPRAPIPAITNENDVRRRYSMVPPPAVVTSGLIVPSVEPVVSEIMIQFGFKRTSTGDLQISIRAMCALWNPYTSAILPEDLRLDISNLPTISVGAMNGVKLQQEFVSATSLNLPFGYLDPGGSPSSAELASWLPGRVYFWRTGVPSKPTLHFFAKLVSVSDGWPITIPAPLLPASGPITVTGPATSLRVVLKRTDGTVLASCLGPQMPEGGGPWTFNFDANQSNITWGVGFGFRLNQPSVNDSKLLLDPTGEDPRSVTLDPTEFRAYDPARGLDPVQYSGSIPTNFDGSSGFLLNRSNEVASPSSYNHDTPAFELPRSPILSLGMLQHIQVAGHPPFSLGNSWGSDIVVTGVDGGGKARSWWDRFFFSGVPSSGWGPDLALKQPFPWYHLRTIDTRSDPSSAFDLGVITNPSTVSSAFLMMGGAFNVNSTSVEAWAAILKSLRPAASNVFSVLRPDPNTGTESLMLPATTPPHAGIDDTVIEDLTMAGGGTTAASSFGFFRFSQSAQETFFTNGVLSGFDRTRYRQGFVGGSRITYPDESPSIVQNPAHTLTSTQIQTLAEAIVSNIRALGPQASMGSFVSAQTALSGASILEHAIASAGINTDLGGEFCSQWLTQADILTAIGPFLQARSDTFTIRTYGEVVNPVLGATDPNYIQGRAWCEAVVQRIPTPVDATTDSIISPTHTFGRRFQIVSFRWLSPDDI